MSLATRCPACGTIFRVVQDQLKVSEGWVRCGQCHEVFHGIESLFDLDSDPAFAARRAARQGAASAPAPATESATTRQAQGGRAAFASAPTAPVPLASVPAPPAATARGGAPAAPAAPARPAAPEADTASHVTSVAPSAAPTPPAPPRGMKPRFAQRWAEAARERAARQAQASAPLAETRPTFAGAPAPAPSIAPFEVAPTTARTPEPASQLEPPPPSFDAPTQPMGLDPADREHVDIALLDVPEVRPEGAAAGSTPATGVQAFEGEVSDEEAAAAARAAEFAAPPGAVPDTALPSAAPVPASLRADGAEVGSAEVPTTHENEDEYEDEEVAGPPTLASMLPEHAATWPPRRGRRRIAAKAPQAPADEAAKPVLESERDHPRFVREARRDERWNRPWVRAGLGVALALLVVAAIGQAAFPWRDTIASRWPSTAPLWSVACEQLDCRIEAPRSIASLTLDGSSLTRTDVDHVLLFAADLHNRSDHAVRMPSFDLSFMDLNGQVVARKVLDPAQIGIQQGALGPEGELHVHARIQVAGLEASGFQAEMFYP